MPSLVRSRAKSCAELPNPCKRSSGVEISPRSMHNPFRGQKDAGRSPVERARKRDPAWPLGPGLRAAPGGEIWDAGGQ
jgi:hypothetical protein